MGTVNKKLEIEDGSPKTQLFPLIPDPLGNSNLVIQVNNKVVNESLFRLGSESGLCDLQEPFKLSRGSLTYPCWREGS
jgi:hypothetical protein